MTHRVLLVGLGAIGIGYDFESTSDAQVRTHAHAFSINKAFGPLAGVDPDPERRRLFIAKYQASVYSSVEAALQAEVPDVVVIATPTVAHHDAVHQILEAVRPKAIVCEKPLAYGLRDAEAMVADCLRCDVNLFVNYMRCSDPGVITVRRMIQGGEIQSPVKGVVWYSKGLIHNGSHFVHLMRRWFGAPRGASIIRAGRSWGDLDSEPDFLLEFSGAAMTFLAAREECFSHYTVELVAKNGRLRYEEGGARIGWQRVIDDPESPGYRVLEPEPTLVRADLARSQLNVVEQLEKALNGMPFDLCTGDEALETLRDIHRIKKLQ